MEDMQLADIIFKVIIGFSIPYAVKTISTMSKSIEELNKKMAVLIERDMNKSKEIDELTEANKSQDVRLTEIEKKIIALQIARGNND